MKPGIVAVSVALVGFCSSIQAQTVAQESMIGCQLERDWESLIIAMSQNDRGNAEALLSKGRCQWLKQGERVSIVKRSISGTYEILYRGDRLFTHRRAIRE
jgi:hypothetical protein